MSAAGFIITGLALIGPSVPVAAIKLQNGLNAVIGPSNTGKTFIAQCINYAMGASTKPKEIPEAAAYETVALSLVIDNTNESIVLSRSLKGGDIRLETNDLSVVLKAKHDPDRTDTVSYFLLEKTGIAGKKIRTHANGKTRDISFRDVAPLVFVSETGVIKEGSPVFTGQLQSRTPELSVFRLLLSGIDDSSIVAKEDRDTLKTKQEGRTEVIAHLLDSAKKKLEALQIDGDAASLRSQLQRVETVFEQASLALAQEQQSTSSLEERRRSAWEKLRHLESRSKVLSELQTRFQLLREQYVSDLRRLESIAEAGVRLAQMPEERCAICGAAPEHHDREHIGQEELSDPGEIVTACQNEALKIRSLIADLQNTVAENNRELVRLNGEREENRSELESSSEELKKELQPRLKVALENFQFSQSRRDDVRDAIALFESISEFQRMLAEVGDTARGGPKEKLQALPGASELETFSKEVENLLRSWRFPDLDRVTFSETDYDMVISGRRRASHGKGVRAVTHAAFTFGLLNYCKNKGFPHPGFALIDSPLIVYRQPDADESGFSPALKDAFYRSLAADFQDRQVIIIENDGPPMDVRSIANIIEFTGAEHGRSGFIPR